VTKDKPNIKKQTDSKEAVSKQSLRLWLRLLSSTNIIEQQIRSRLRKKFNITLPQFDVLAELERKKEAQTMTELSRHLMVSNGNITGVVDRLVREGFVKRLGSDSDRRIQYINLTNKGRRTFDRMAKANEEWIAELFSDMTQTEVLQLSEQLHYAKASINKNLADGEQQ
jgi:DNA-binding MarR family transcriptional regulator